MPRISRRAIAAIIAVSTLLPGAAFAADPLKEIRIDWATYNPVSMVLKQKGLLEKEFAKDGISVVWVQSAGSNKALEFLNAGSIDFGSTAGSAALVAKINGNPIKSIYVYSQPEWTALVTRKDTGLGLDYRPLGAGPRAVRRAPQSPPRRRSARAWTAEQERLVRVYHDMGLNPRQIAERARESAPRLAITESLAVRILSAPRR